jgi:hypothetical protein
MVIIFASEKARKQLLKKGFVWTFRVHRRKLQTQGAPRRVSFDWATDHRCGKKLCDVSIQNETEINHWDELAKFVDASGFETVNDWIAEIITRNHGRPTNAQGWLYLVSKR